MVDEIEKRTNKHTRSVTGTLKIYGYTQQVDFKDPFYFYGCDAFEIKNHVAQEPNGWISRKLQIHQQQVLWAVRYEMARTVEDVLSRRTRALLLDAAESISMAPAVAHIMAEYFKYDDNWIKAQVQAYTHLAKNYLINS